MFIANKHHLSCEYHGLVIKYIKSHHPNWCIKVGTHPKAALVGGGGHTNFFCNQTWQGQLVMFSLKLLLKKNFGTPFYGWDSTVSRLHSHYKETVHFLPLGLQGFLVLIWSTLEGWKAVLTLEPPSGLEPDTPGLEIQHLNH